MLLILSQSFDEKEKKKGPACKIFIPKTVVICEHFFPLTARITISCFKLEKYALNPIIHSTYITFFDQSKDLWHQMTSLFCHEGASPMLKSISSPAT